MAEIDLRPAGSQELRAIAARRRFDDRSFALAARLAEEGGAWVVLDQGESIGMSLLHATAEEHYVGDLYVEPSYRGNGVGATLLDAALESGAGGLARTVLLDPADAAAAALVLRRGIAVRTPVLRVSGAVPKDDVLAAMAASEYRFDVESIDPSAHAFSLDALDRETRGAPRGPEHARFARAATGSALLRGDEFVAYAYAWPDGRIGPMAAVSAAYLVPAFALALLVLRRSHAASWCSLLLPATNVRLLRAALRCGLRIERSYLLASDAAQPELSRYAGFDPLLF